MRYSGRQGRGSRGWWGVFVFALLATGAYLAFDVLDLDGSEMRAWAPAPAASAEPPRAEPSPGDRPGPMPGTLGFVPLLRPHDAAVLWSWPASASATALRIARRGRGLPRGRAVRDTGLTAPAPDDPA